MSNERVPVADHFYRVSGVTMRSELALTNLVEIADGGVADLTVMLGTVSPPDAAPTVSGALFDAGPGWYRLRAPRAGVFHVEDGRKVIIDLARDASMPLVQAFLLGTVLNAALIQRGKFVLHASAVASSKGAIVVGGAPGHGKSSLAAEFVRRGYELLADDLVVVEVGDDGRPMALPAFPSIKLWPDMLNHFGWSESGVVVEQQAGRKYQVASPGRFVTGARAVAATYKLSLLSGATPGIVPFEGGDRLMALRGLVRLNRLAEGLGTHVQTFSVASALVNSSRIARLVRPPTPLPVCWLADMIEADLD